MKQFYFSLKKAMDFINKDLDLNHYPINEEKCVEINLEIVNKETQKNFSFVENEIIHAVSTRCRFFDIKRWDEVKQIKVNGFEKRIYKNSYLFFDNGNAIFNPAKEEVEYYMSEKASKDLLDKPIWIHFKF